MLPVPMKTIWSSNSCGVILVWRECIQNEKVCSVTVTGFGGWRSFLFLTNHIALFQTTGSPPDLDDPVILSEIRKGTTVKSLCANISTELLREFNYSLVWGTSAKHTPQRCGLNHHLDDEDVVQIVIKTVKQQQTDKSYVAMSQTFADKHAKKRLEAKKQKQKRLRGWAIDEYIKVERVLFAIHKEFVD